MQTQLECLPCFLSQAIRTLRMSGLDNDTVENAIQGVQGTLLAVSREDSPIEVAERIQQIIREVTGCDDLYAEIKMRSNMGVELLLPELASGLEKGHDPFEYMLRCSLAGNLIDYGVYAEVDPVSVMNRVVSAPFVGGHSLEDLRRRMSGARSLAFLTDNAGEIVFDRFWLEWIQRTYSFDRILIAVRDRPFLNDATLEDARHAGLDRVENVELVAFWPEERMKGRQHHAVWQRLSSMDLVIAKGQANFEALSNEPGVFFHFVVKCGQVVSCLGDKTGHDVELGSFVCWRNPGDRAGAPVQI
ncbi:MAG: ARMT1-like domain-containing protein [Opitutales bacterium]|nr:ARMT1-like domain-containing protein [Opitutales bacterium]